MASRCSFVAQSLQGSTRAWQFFIQRSGSGVSAVIGFRVVGFGVFLGAHGFRVKLCLKVSGPPLVAPKHPGRFCRRHGEERRSRRGGGSGHRKLLCFNHRLCFGAAPLMSYRQNRIRDSGPRSLRSPKPRCLKPKPFISQSFPDFPNSESHSKPFVKEPYKIRSTARRPVLTLSSNRTKSPPVRHGPQTRELIEKPE